MKKYKVTVEKLEETIELEEGLSIEDMAQQVFDFIAAELIWEFEEIKEITDEEETENK